MPKNNEIKVAVNNSIRSFASSHETANLVSIQNNQPVTTSLKVAELFGKRHRDVLRAIRSIDCSDTFRERNFALSFYFNDLSCIDHKEQPMYYLTRDGFTFLAMGFTGKVAAKFKEDYINAFNEMESMLKSKESMKAANKMLGDEVKRLNKRLRSAVREGQAKYGKNYGPYGDIQVGVFHSDQLSFRDNLANLCSMVQSAFSDGYFVAKEMRDAKGLLSQFREFLSKFY